MAVSYPLAMPGAPGFRGARFGLRASTAVFASPLSGAEQVVEREGARWVAEYALPPMTRAQAAAWVAFLTSLRGRRGTFRGFDPDARAPRGVATGTPRVMGAAQAGNQLATDGWTASTAGILKAGDYVSLAAPAQRLYQVVEDAASDSLGRATLSLEPRLRESPDDDALLATANPWAPFRLLDDEAAWETDALGAFGITFSAAEAL